MSKWAVEKRMEKKEKSAVVKEKKVKKEKTVSPSEA